MVPAGFVSVIDRPPFVASCGLPRGELLGWGEGLQGHAMLYEDIQKVRYQLGPNLVSFRRMNAL